MLPLHTTVYARHVPVVTWVIIAVNALVFLFEVELPRDTLEKMTYLFGVVPARFTDPAWAERVGFPLHDYWPFVTSMFLHGGLLHIVGNMWTLAVFGRNVEDQMGPLRYLVFYFLCGIVSGIAHTLINSTSELPAIGASGAIAGVMGAYLVMYPKSRVVVMVLIVIFPLFFDLLAVVYLVFWFLLQLFSGVMELTQTANSSGIAVWAHVGGFLFGALLLPLFVWGSRRRQPHPDEGGVEHAWGHLR